MTDPAPGAPSIDELHRRFAGVLDDAATRLGGLPFDHIVVTTSRGVPQRILAALPYALDRVVADLSTARDGGSVTPIFTREQQALVRGFTIPDPVPVVLVYRDGRRAVYWRYVWSRTESVPFGADVGLAAWDLRGPDFSGAERHPLEAVADVIFPPAA